MNLIIQNLEVEIYVE